MHPHGQRRIELPQAVIQGTTARDDTFFVEASSARFAPGERPRTILLNWQGAELVFNWVNADMNGDEIAGDRYLERDGKRKLLVAND